MAHTRAEALTMAEQPGVVMQQGIVYPTVEEVGKSAWVGGCRARHDTSSGSERIILGSLSRRFCDFLRIFQKSTFRYDAVVECMNLITAQGWAFADFGLRLGARLDAVGDAEAVRVYYHGEGDSHWEG